MRLTVQKTYKLFIGGKFPRTESARFLQATGPKGDFLANISRASRKDVRDSVSAARKAFESWAGRSAYNRGQILYRIAEVLESRADAFAQEISLQNGATKAAALAEVAASVDRLVWYAGWSDKFTQIFSSINPVASAYWNFTAPEASGVVGIAVPNDNPLLALVSLMAPVIVSGNACVIVAPEKYPLSAVSFAEVLAASDVPGGVVNILTGLHSELITPLASHMDINAVVYAGNDASLIKNLQSEAAENVKRIVLRKNLNAKNWANAEAQSPYWIQDTVEFKTAWHPVGA